MKATVVLIADNETENYGRRLMLEAHQIGNLGFEMARLPQHISLKQPFAISSLDEMEAFFDEMAKEFKPVGVQFERLNVYPSKVLGGSPSGCLSIEVRESQQLKEMQELLFRKLEERFGDCPAEHDDNYVFHMTIAIGGAPYENYLNAFEALSKRKYNQSFTFRKIGLLYYDDDGIRPGTYFCYKILDIA
jgi:2'-5' RNA ligase